MRKFFCFLGLFFFVSFLHAQIPGGTTINGLGGPFTFTGSGVSCTGYVCTFSGGGGAVTSVFGRTGAITSVAGDYSAFYGQLAVANTWIASNVFNVNDSTGILTRWLDRGGANAFAVRGLTQFSTALEGNNATVIGFSGSTDATAALTVGFSVGGGNTIACGNGNFADHTCSFLLGTLNASTSVISPTYKTAIVCSQTASPAACGAATAGVVQIAASATSLVIDSTNFTATTGCWFAYDVSGITAPSNMGNLLNPYISARTAGTSITITLPIAPATSPVNVQFGCEN